MAQVVVVQTGYLGDVMLTTPLLSALAEQHGQVDLITQPDAVPLAETFRAVASVIPLDKRGEMKGAGGLSRFAAYLRRRRYRIAYLPHRSLRSALLPWVARVPRRVGFNDAPGRWLYTETRPRRGSHEAERLLCLTDGDWGSRLELTLTDSDHQAALQALREGGITAPFVVVAPGSVWATKRWPYFRELSRRISCTHPVVALGTQADRGSLDDSLRGGGAPCLDLAGRLQIREAAAVIARATVAVTNDSAPMHLAGAMGTPVVALFGPTATAAGFGPRGELDITVELGELGCRPCSTHGSARCPRRHHRCMRDLPVDTVVQAVERILAHSSSGVASSCE